MMRTFSTTSADKKVLDILLLLQLPLRTTLPNKNQETDLNSREKQDFKSELGTCFSIASMGIVINISPSFSTDA